MAFYIYLIWHQIVIHCAEAAAGCMQVSVAHFDYLMSAGALEMILEIAGIVKIFKKKDKAPDNTKKEI
jgi:hypothetical protein